VARAIRVIAMNSDVNHSEIATIICPYDSFGALSPILVQT
jgi:hypothetical protein